MLVVGFWVAKKVLGALIRHTKGLLQGMPETCSGAVMR